MPPPTQPPSTTSKANTPVTATEPAKATSSTTAGAMPKIYSTISDGATTRLAAQQAMIQQMQSRINLLENTLKTAQQKIKEHESSIDAQSTESNNISSNISRANGVELSTAPTSQPQFVSPMPSIASNAASIVTTDSIANIATDTIANIATYATTYAASIDAACNAPTNVSFVPLPPFDMSRIYPYTATRDSPLLYTSTANAETTNMYTSSPVAPQDPRFNNMPSPFSANTGLVRSPLPCQPRKLQELPEFNGKPEEWPVFYTAFIESTTVYAYSNFENNLRLQKCLKGEARETVKSLLIHPNNVGNVIEQLKFRFGRPEQLIRSQLAQVREITAISEASITKLVPFAAKVNNVCAFLQSAYGGEQHINNPTLLDELIAKLPMSKRIEWAVFATSLHPYATILHFSQWLTKLANVICTVYDGDSTRDNKRKVVLHATESQRQLKCPMCQEQHKLPECKQFIKLSVTKRWAEVKQRHLCFACLNTGHGTRNCQRRKPCATDGCKRMHHKLLHEIEIPENKSPNHSKKSQDHAKRVSDAETYNSPNKQTQPEVQSVQSRDTGAAVLSCNNNVCADKVLFRILPVVLHANKKRIETYALFDEGSSITMVDSALIDELGLHGRSQCLNLQWFGGQAAQEPATVVDLQISGAGMQKRHKLKNVYAVSNLQLPSQSLSKADISHMNTLVNKLPVQPYAKVNPKLLIGIDHCHLGLPSTTMKVNNNGPFAANTELGWVVFGPMITTQPQVSSCLLVNCLADQSLHNMVANYFDTENFGVRAAPPIESVTDVRAREILRHTTRKVEGRFQTGLLWKHSNVELPNSYDMALKRLRSIEAKMKRNTDFAEEYKRIMNSYVEKGYARKMSPKETMLPSARTWYLPHFAVSNPNKPGKLRMVFDAAAEVNGVSLNSQLLKGPQEYRPLPAILYHFREGAIGVCGDIKEMFHQVLIQPGDRCAQRFLWRNGDTEKQPDIYEMRVMTFGAACSPCAAHYVKTINALEHRNEGNGANRAVKSILHYHYVDDYVDSFDTEEEAIDISRRVRAIHMAAGFELRNFTSNSTNVVVALDGSGGSEGTRQIANKEGVPVERVLGLIWHASSDDFKFKLKFSKVDTNVVNGARRPTKRELLSIIMSIFDPLGFLSNFLIYAKIIMREVWKHDIRWDEPLPDDINAAWEGWRKQLPIVAEYAIPRHYFRKGIPTNLQLHIFVDASEDAFAAVAYWRSVNALGEVEVSFICAKTKCAPTKSLTIPRLELQAAVLGTRLMGCIQEEHSLDIENCVIWSDSTTVVQWLRSEHRRYKPFVQHRVAEILSATTIANWRWLPTDQNVADEATRTNDSVNFSSTARWSTGPPFLLQNERDWPIERLTTCSREEADKELRPKYALVMVKNDLFDFNRFSSFSKLVRTTAWVRRFVGIRRRREEPDRRYGLTSNEIESATLCLCRLVQQEAFTEELQQLVNGQALSSASPLYQLSPYIDKEGVLRVQGRIDAASWLAMSTRRPIILPSSHAFTKLVILHAHYNMRHQNSEATICEIRRKYWVPRLRTLLRNVISNCPVCRLNKATAVAPVMGPLPIDRLTPYIRPFSYTGIDYFGPINVTIRRSTEKRWVALFTCLTVRAVHLELAHDLSTDSCILAIRNFINRRGIPKRIRSDNGKNFVGVDAESKRFSEVFDCSRLQSELSQKGVEWVFNSPYNPAEGGAWERLVQCVKRVLRQTLKEVAPREHTLNCFLIEAENIVNSRPLTHLPIDVNQEQPLTPNDFLLGEDNSAQTPIAADVLDKTCVLRQQWRIARQLRDHFWKRWITEYLPTLTRRVKWCQKTKPLQIGDLVYICDPNVPRREWCRGKVEAIYPGADGEVRRADVRTADGLKRRATSKLAVLDVDGGESR